LKIEQVISPCLWYDGKAEEAAAHYISVFPDSEINDALKSDTAWPGGKLGDTVLVSFTIAGLQFQALNGGPDESFNNAVSLSIICKDQKEVDYYWDALTANGGEAIQCGWLKDKYGLRWQVVPKALIEMMHDKNRDKANRVMAAMMQMVKFDIATLKRAYDG
jgi:predicted 3-demethylubiquinone-9 3-methyltransferase (glyoxalase superfamily)